MKRIRIALAVALGLSLAMSVQAQVNPFGKNNVRYNQLDQRYESYRFDVWHNLDLNSQAQAEHLKRVVESLENARDWMSRKPIFDHIIEKRIPVLLYKTHADMESSNLVGGFMPEGVGAFVESDRKRMVLKADFSRPLGRAIGVHELVHEFQFDIYNLSIFDRMTGRTNLPDGYFEGCAEFIAGLYDPHTRDDIRRREQRNYAANPKSLPTWDSLKSGRNNPYTMWSMLPEFLEAKFSAGIAFCTKPLRSKAGLGEFIYDVTVGELGNPDINSEKFDQRHRYYWGTELGFETQRIKRPKPYEENDNFKGRSVTPWGHPSPMLSPALSPDGTKLAAFTVYKYGVSLVVFDIPREDVFMSAERRRQLKDNKKTFMQNMAKALITDLTPHLPPIPWEYLVVQGFETWPFNGFDLSWSKDGGTIAVFARINRDHALVLLDAKNGEIKKKIEFKSPGLLLDQAFSPSFSSDGKKIYFSAAKDITRDIYSIDIESESIENITDDDRFDTAPAVSSDGTQIIYVGQDGDFQHLFLLDLASGNKEQLTFGRFNDGWPSWSDDGSTIIYASDEADRIWNLYTLDLRTRTVRQRTEFFGSAETPIFARNSLDTVYYVVFRDDDQYKDAIYPNYEIFEAKLKKPIREYIVQNTGLAGGFVFNPTRDIFKFELDENQILNRSKPPEKWGCGGGNISFGVSSYWGMFGQSFIRCSNILETKNHLGQFIYYGNFRIFDYTYLNQEKRSSKLLRFHHNQMPIGYQYFDLAERFPKQPVLNQTWIEETSFDMAVLYPSSKFVRWELYSRLRHRSFNVSDLDPEIANSVVDSYSSEDAQVFRFLRDSSGSSLAFGAAYIRDTILYSGNTWGPFHGNALRAQFEFAPPAGGKLQGYTSANVSARTYRHLGASSLFAGRAEFMANSRPNGDFMLLCGPERLRGCEYGSIVGNQVGYASAELRFPIPGTYLLYQNIRGILFADATSAKFSDTGLPAQKLKAYGFGLHYLIPFIGFPAQTIWTRDSGKWKPSFYITMHW